MRHRLMHFTSPRKTMEHDGAVIQELADTTLYDNLKAKSATQAFRTAEDFCAKYSDCGALLRRSASCPSFLDGEVADLVGSNSLG